MCVCMAACAEALRRIVLVPSEARHCRVACSREGMEARWYAYAHTQSHTHTLVHSLTGTHTHTHTPIVTHTGSLTHSQVAPWSKTGGLGDVMGALPGALAARGHRVMVVAPYYAPYKGAENTGVSLPAVCACTW